MADSRPIGPFLYLPIEVASRELQAKLLLAHAAVARGYEVVIGWKRMINKNLRYMPPGIVMFKTLTANDGETMTDARAARAYSPLRLCAGYSDACERIHNCFPQIHFAALAQINRRRCESRPFALARSPKP